MRSLKTSLSSYEKEIQSILSSVDKLILARAVEKNVERLTKTTIKTHQKKIRNLTKKIVLPFTHNETIHDLSTITLTTEELDVLKYGLKHPIHPLHVNKTDMKIKVVNLKQNYHIWPILMLAITDHESML